MLMRLQRASTSRPWNKAGFSPQSWFTSRWSLHYSSWNFSIFPNLLFLLLYPGHSTAWRPLAPRQPVGLEVQPSTPGAASEPLAQTAWVMKCTARSIWASSGFGSMSIYFLKVSENLRQHKTQKIILMMHKILDFYSQNVSIVSVTE